MNTELVNSGSLQTEASVDAGGDATVEKFKVDTIDSKHEAMKREVTTRFNKTADKVIREVMNQDTLKKKLSEQMEKINE